MQFIRHEVKGKHNRRTFFRWTGLSLLAGGAVLWHSMVGTEKKLTGKRKITIPYDPARESLFHEDFIVLNRSGYLNVLSARCSHLGCTIREVSNGQLLCPCHGSTFDLEGNPLRGPAIRPLDRLPFMINKAEGLITVEL